MFGPADLVDRFRELVRVEASQALLTNGEFTDSGEV
jgi:hypothetical protein